jgi:hypothetical protein
MGLFPVRRRRHSCKTGAAHSSVGWGDLAGKSCALAAFREPFCKRRLVLQIAWGLFNTLAANFASCGSKQSVGVAALYRLKGYNKMRMRSIKMALPSFQAKRTSTRVNKACKNK